MAIGFYAGLVRDGRRKAFLLGPYDTREAAASNVERAHDAACEIDPFCWFDEAGVFCLEAQELPSGRLNGLI
jgi:hypothetical protein